MLTFFFPCMNTFFSNSRVPARASLTCHAIVGIDLGTTNSAIAHVGSENCARVIADDSNKATFPSVVTVLEAGEQLVGWAAAAASPNSSTTFTSFKRLMGQRSDDAAAHLEGQLGYEVREGPGGEAAASVAGTDKLMTPEELSSLVLRHMVRIAEYRLGEPVTGAVVAVPAHFNQRQRSATLAAAELAGIPTVHLLQEPVAAALAYGIDGGIDGETVLVFDVGGGTFDVSVLQAFEGIMQVLGTGGDSRLGGDDFDALLADWILDHYRLPRLGEARGWALAAARAAKEALSQAESALIEAPAAASTMESLMLTQETFEALSEGLFQRMASVMDSIGKEHFIEWAEEPSAAASMPSTSSCDSDSSDSSEGSADRWAPPPRKISKVALVGQVTRLPSVRRFVQRVTGVEPCVSVDPGAAVALGAATQAGVLIGSVGSVELMDGSFVGDLHSRVTGFSDWQP